MTADDRQTGAAPLAPVPSDQPARDAIVGERGRNVAVVAGAGTGKTRTIIERAVELLAPRAPAAAAVPIQRMALITFTRRAAGELRFRIREHLLRAIEHEARRDGRRTELLRNALGNLDAAFVGTIHGFADRLLRLRPVEARLSPAYALVDDTSDLVRETFVRLRRAAEAGTLRAELGSSAASVEPVLLAEAAETLRAAARAGLQLGQREGTYGPLPSLELLLARMIETRDVSVELCSVPDPGLDQARAAVARLEEMVRRMRGGEFGHRSLRRIAYALRRLRDTGDAAEALRIVQEAQRGRDLYKGRDFADDVTGWSIYTAIRPSNTKPGSLGEQLKGPHRWLATRLVRLFPVVRALYERVKAEHEVVDYLDLLIKLRDLLRDDPVARRFYQGLFDHVFVDEFQDTDPLQCEIVFYLCEDGAAARRWDTVTLQPGKLTIVGDPQQSIYRFRRADIVMYERATERLRAGGALEQRLHTNFRSRPELIAFFNAQLAQVLGTPTDTAIDAHRGRAGYEALQANASVRPAGVAVHVVPYAGGGGEGLVAGDGRAVEAAALAHYVRWLLAAGRPVRDPDTDREHPVRPRDIAVLACVTTNLPLLLRQFDGLGIEYTARGGALFLGHPVVRQYLLGLRALADRDDGVARAALLQPPFFGLDWADIVAGQALKDADDARARRLQEANALIDALRARRHLQTPGATARDLIERTALGRSLAVARNGQQTLAALYEVAAEIDRRAAIGALDYDAVTEIVRGWAEAPVFLDAPEPTGASAVRVMTVHSAKGLEFPVVILWDGFQTFSDRGAGTWCVARDGTSWALSLGAVAVEHPAGGLLAREKQFAEEERRRMYYVAATRARDLLVLPAPLTKSKQLAYATAELLRAADGAHLHCLEPFRTDAPPPWARQVAAHGDAAPQPDAALQAQLDAARAAFASALDAAARPIAAPVAVTDAATARAPEPADTAAERERKAAGGRFGAVFGSVVHRALELMVSGAADAVGAAVGRAARETGLEVEHADAEADVQRGLDALHRFGLLDGNAFSVAAEYPLAADWEGGTLLNGFIDLLAVSDDQIVVIDFKTDAPAAGAVEAAYPRYAAQLRLYGELLRRAGLLAHRTLRLGLLLTASGELRWL